MYNTSISPVKHDIDECVQDKSCLYVRLHW